MTEATPPLVIALTGATGFVGRRVLALATCPVRALTRRPQPPQPGVEWVLGDLDDTHALARLCSGASAVIHVAGVVNAADEAGFMAGNVRGTGNAVSAAQAAAVPRFVHVSSLAAREPALSLYGKSKAIGDTAVAMRFAGAVIVRPPGVYGPGDTEMRDLFRLARFGFGLAPGGPAARISLIHVDDLARALLALALAPSIPISGVLEIDDGAGEHGGYAHADHAAAIGRALGKAKVRMIPIGNGLISAAAGIATRIAKLKDELPKLSRDRARYLSHPDWVARGGNARLAGLWEPRISLDAGMADTVRDYRQRGWL